MEYTKSTTKVSEQAVEKMLESGYGSEWTHPRTGKVRVYLNISDLSKVIGLEVGYYKSGSINGCAYIDIDGERIVVANSRGWQKASHKCYIEDGHVYSSWNPYGADIAELVAVRAMEEFAGVDPDGGDCKEQYMVTADSDHYSNGFFNAMSDAEAALEEWNAKFPERGYRIARVEVGNKTGRVREIA